MEPKRRELNKKNEDEENVPTQRISQTTIQPLSQQTSSERSRHPARKRAAAPNFDMATNSFPPQKRIFLGPKKIKKNSDKFCPKWLKIVGTWIHFDPKSI